MGKKGEQYVSDYLSKKGFEILDLNWRQGKYELDLISRKDDTIVVVEVKTRSNRVSHIDEVLSESKINSLQNAANLYMEGVDENLDCRIDLILLQKIGEDFDVIHIEDAITQA